MSTSTDSIDAIGDVHGCCEQLLSLLAKLGYSESGGRWRAPAGHGLVFLGDYIDRGPQPYETYRTIRNLCEQGLALAILGNHDTNAIQFCARRAERTIAPAAARRVALEVLDGKREPERGWIRDHTRGFPENAPSNVWNHAATLRNMDEAQYAEYIDWVRRLPAWIEIEGRIRFIHAAWVDSAIGKLERWAAGACELRTGKTRVASLGIAAVDFARASKILRERLAGASPYADSDWCELVDIGTGREDACCFTPTENAAIALERLTKGIEFVEPSGIPMVDATGVARNRFRARWYLAPKGVPFERLALMRGTLLRKREQSVRSRPIPVTDLHPAHDGQAYPADAPPVLFGHYGLAPEDFDLFFHPKCACVDFSGFHDGDLYAYRWRGETELVRTGFAWVPGRGMSQAH